MACVAAYRISLAARVRILERQLQKGAQERDGISALLLATARNLNNLLDTHAGDRARSGSWYLAEHMLKIIRRVNSAAIAVRHAAEFAPTQLSLDVVDVLGRALAVSERCEVPNHRDGNSDEDSTS